MGTPTAELPPTSQRVDPRRGFDRDWAISAIIAVATFVVIAATAPDGMWLDETISVRRSALPLTTLTTFSLGGEPNMALFHYLLWPLGQLHAADWVFRLVPIAAGSLVLGSTYLLGCRLFDRPTAAIATGVLAVHGLTTRYATEVRGYSLVVLLMVVCALLLDDAVRRDRKRSWALFVALAVASFGLHFVAVMFVGAQLVALLAVRNVVNRRHALLAVAAVGVGVVVLGIIWVVSDQDYWVAWLPELSDEVAVGVAKSLAGGTLLALAVLGGFAVWGSVHSCVALRDDPWRAWPNALVLSCAWLPLGAGVLASFTHPLAYPRYFLAVLPPLALLAGRGVLALPRHPVIPGIATVALLGAVAIGHTDLDRRAREGMDDATAYVLSHIEPGDGVFLPYNEDLSGFQWYADGGLPDGVIDVRPGTPADAIRDDWWWEDPQRLGPDMPKLANAPREAWQQTLEPIDRVWVVSGFIAKDERFYDTGSGYVPEGRVECDRQWFEGIDVVLFARSCD